MSDVVINTSNEFLLGLTHRGPHTPAGAPCIRPSGVMPYWNTRQGAYRFAAWLISMADMLPDEDDSSHDFPTILKAIQNS